MRNWVGARNWEGVRDWGGVRDRRRGRIDADVMAHGAINAESKGMMPFALIHDQGLAIQDRGQKPEDFAQALSKVPPWATGLPLRVEAKLVPYYSK